MSKKSTYLLGIILTILIGTLLYWKFCCCCSCKNSNDEKMNGTCTTGMGEYNIFNLSGNGINYQCYDNFKFKQNGFDIWMPVSDSINNGIDLLKASFEKNQNQKLVITGYYTKDEKNTSAFPDLGLARANAVKNYFVSKGLPSDKFDVKSEMRDTWALADDTIFGPIDLFVSETDVAATATTTTTDENWDALKSKINANPLVLYFNTNQSEVNLTAEERQKVADITKYLDHVSGAKVNAVGHTDNVGDRNKNIQLGQNRADFAKSYLVKNGLDAAKIISSSKGPDEPIADNATADGRTKNRRTVVTIQ